MFTIDELTILKMYINSDYNRTNTVNAMKDILPFIEEDEICETVKSIIRKANAMTQEEFEKLDFTDILEEI